MKTIFILSAFLVSALSFAQTTIDLNEKEAKTAFINSNIRKELKIKKSAFNYNEFIRLSNLWNEKTKLSEIFILNSTDDKELLDLIKRYYSWYLHNEETKGTSGCNDCNSILYQNKNNTNKKDLFFR